MFKWVAVRFHPCLNQFSSAHTFRNILKEGGLFDLTLFVGRGVLLCRKIVQLLALLLELDHFAPLKADAGLTTVRQHGGVHGIVLYFHSYSNPFFYLIPKICSINMFQFMSFLWVF
ncbi:unnamed protein product [Brassica rapa subsp. trilocularis]